jgi:hypothetical protein
MNLCVVSRIPCDLPDPSRDALTGLRYTPVIFHQTLNERSEKPCRYSQTE